MNSVTWQTCKVSTSLPEGAKIWSSFWPFCYSSTLNPPSNHLAISSFFLTSFLAYRFPSQSSLTLPLHFFSFQISSEDRVARVQGSSALNHAASRAKEVCTPGNLQQSDVRLAEALRKH